MRVGIVGVATTYWPVAIARGLQASRGVHLVAAASLGVTATVARRYLGVSPEDYADGLGIELYRDPEEMVERERLDAVVLCTRHTRHAKWTEAMAKLGLDIFIPKTFATTLADTERIVRAQRQYRVNIAVGPSGRYVPAIAAAKRAVAKGRIGRPFAMRLCHHHGTLDSFPKGDWYRDPREGGPELSLGWYVIDLVLDFMGRRVESVFAQYANYTSPDSPFMDCGKLVMRLAGGAMASCDMYFCNRVPYPSWEMEVVGPRGAVRVHPVRAGSTEIAASLCTARGTTPLPPPRRTPHWELFWVEDFKKGRPAAISPDVAAAITRISLAARDSARKGRPVVLTEV